MKRNIFIFVVVYALYWPGFIFTHTHTHTQINTHGNMHTK